MVKCEKSNCKQFNILFTCIGRRVSLLNSFKKAAKELHLKCQFFGTEQTVFSSAFQLCDKKFIVDPVSHQKYINQLLQIVRKNNVKVLVPTVDLDLKELALNKDKFAEYGCKVLVSSPEVVGICQDKRETFKFLKKHNFDTPQTMTAPQAIAKKSLKYPCFLKPWDGYASRGTAVVRNRKELAFYANSIPNCIVQEFIKGFEYTCDCFIDFEYQVRCVVPRKRLEVRSGEVSKGQTVKNKKIMEETAKLAKTLQAGPGIITIQLILTQEQNIKFVEINPRFGGGAPLSIKAGANFPKWILSQLIGKKPQIKFDGFKDNLTMLRYDAEVWLKSYGD
ncbi:MAG: ATP-grasp domain-containing protein [Sedimentisphaerales bacterium]|nr:ATP-grasp domain-containing protein [Sedimentisphaerales bacterium]